MTRLTPSDLTEFQQAIYKDYGVILPEEVLYQEAFNLLSFIESLVKFDQNDKQNSKNKPNIESEVLKPSMQDS